MEYHYAVGEQTFKVQVELRGGEYAVIVDGRAYTVSVAPVTGRTGELSFALDGARQLAWVAVDGPRRWVALEGQAAAPVVLTVPAAGGSRRYRSSGEADALEAQMPGVVRRVLVAEGEAVERGQVLVVLEAMKMEIRVSAPRAGSVQRVGVKEGQPVERGQVLVALVNRDQSG